MFFIGVSCSILPYVLAIAFAWLIIGSNTDVPVKHSDTVAVSKIIQYQPSHSKVQKAYYYYQTSFLKVDNFELSYINQKSSNEWTICYNVGSYIDASPSIPNRRGPPVNLVG
ncbi:MAG: hypothetical protein AB7S48_08925 [Bacteroidales bacterium]